MNKQFCFWRPLAWSRSCCGRPIRLQKIVTAFARLELCWARQGRSHKSTRFAWYWTYCTSNILQGKIKGWPFMTLRLLQPVGNPKDRSFRVVWCTNWPTQGEWFRHGHPGEKPSGNGPDGSSLNWYRYANGWVGRHRCLSIILSMNSYEFYWILGFWCPPEMDVKEFWHFHRLRLRWSHSLIHQRGQVVPLHNERSHHRFSYARSELKNQGKGS